MKTGRTHVFVLAVLVIALLPAISGRAAEKATFTGTETFTGVFVEPGEMTCPGHESILFPPSFCPPGTRIKLRGLIRQYFEDHSDWRATGINTVTENWNFDENVVGPMWGTFRLDVDSHSYWEGTWTGEWNGVVGTMKMVGHGGGDFEGLQIRSVCDYPSMPTGTCTGEILDPHEKK